MYAEPGNAQGEITEGSLASPKVSITQFGPPLIGMPHVSVLMITFNHEAFVRDAIESVFAQKCTRQMELIIGEDRSTDRTSDVIHDVCRDAPIPVRLIQSDNNVGMHANFQRCLHRCTADVVALLEGDDRWIVDQKLQNQLDVLEESPGTVMTFHGVRVLDQRRNLGSGGCHEISDWEIPKSIPSRVDFSTLAGDCCIQTSSVAFKKEALPTLPSWVFSLPWVDWAIYLLLASRGRIEYIPQTMSEYRLHEGGITNKWTSAYAAKGAADMFEALIYETTGDDSKFAADYCVRNFFKCAQLFEQQGSLRSACAAAFRVLRLKGVRDSDGARAIRFLMGASLRRLSAIRSLAGLR